MRMIQCKLYSNTYIKIPIVTHNTLVYCTHSFGCVNLHYMPENKKFSPHGVYINKESCICSSLW